jgi:hypothetical protein
MAASNAASCDSAEDAGLFTTFTAVTPNSCSAAPSAAACGRSDTWIRKALPLRPSATKAAQRRVPLSCPSLFTGRIHARKASPAAGVASLLSASHAAAKELSTHSALLMSCTPETCRVQHVSTSSDSGCRKHSWPRSHASACVCSVVLSNRNCPSLRTHAKPASVSSCASVDRQSYWSTLERSALLGTPHASHSALRFLGARRIWSKKRSSRILIWGACYFGDPPVPGGKLTRASR